MGYPHVNATTRLVEIPQLVLWKFHNSSHGHSHGNSTTRLMKFHNLSRETSTTRLVEMPPVVECKESLRGNATFHYVEKKISMVKFGT